MGINDLDDERWPEDPKQLGEYAARHYKPKKAQNRLKCLREFASLCEALADAFERRVEEESVIRRIT